jgi:ubiquinone/menaquinone biosynthesis C-methylase UbiE
VVPVIVPGATDERQLIRQVEWLRDHWLWLLDTEVLPTCGRARPSALDVGSGPGIAAEALSARLEITSLDLDMAACRGIRGRGLEAVRGDALSLPFADGSFDIVYCSFFLLWTQDPSAALKEMARVSRQWVLCLAEPDHAGKIVHPEARAPLTHLISEGMEREGADPRMGSKLAGLFFWAGLSTTVGTYPGTWTAARSVEEMEAEWSWMESTAGEGMKKLRPSWDAAVADGSLLLFNPIFYALGRKT